VVVVVAVSVVVVVAVSVAVAVAALQPPWQVALSCPTLAQAHRQALRPWPALSPTPLQLEPVVVMMAQDVLGRLPRPDRGHPRSSPQARNGTVQLWT
jgi:hypothetical protein